MWFEHEAPTECFPFIRLHHRYSKKIFSFKSFRISRPGMERPTSKYQFSNVRDVAALSNKHTHTHTNSLLFLPSLFLSYFGSIFTRIHTLGWKEKCLIYDPRWEQSGKSFPANFSGYSFVLHILVYNNAIYKTLWCPADHYRYRIYDGLHQLLPPI